MSVLRKFEQPGYAKAKKWIPVARGLTLFAMNNSDDTAVVGVFDGTDVFCECNKVVHDKDVDYVTFGLPH